MAGTSPAMTAYGHQRQHRTRKVVITGLVPVIHVLALSPQARRVVTAEERGWPGHLARRRASRLSPAMTKNMPGTSARSKASSPRPATPHSKRDADAALGGGGAALVDIAMPSIAPNSATFRLV